MLSVWLANRTNMFVIYPAVWGLFWVGGMIEAVSMAGTAAEKAKIAAFIAGSMLFCLVILAVLILYAAKS